MPKFRKYFICENCCLGDVELPKKLSIFSAVVLGPKKRLLLASRSHPVEFFRFEACPRVTSQGERRSENIQEHAQRTVPPERF